MSLPTALLILGCAVAWVLAVFCGTAAAPHYLWLILQSLAFTILFGFLAARLWRHRAARIPVLVFCLPLTALALESVARLASILAQ
jgi:hypothetical protein